MKDDSAKEVQKTAAAGAVAVAEKAGPSSAALAAKDRIHRAVEAAKARSGAGPRLENITHRRR